MRTFEELALVKEANSFLVGKNAVRSKDRKVYLVLSLSIQPIAPEKIIIAPRDAMDLYVAQEENDVFVSIVAVDLVDSVILPLERFVSDFAIQD